MGFHSRDIEKLLRIKTTFNGDDHEKSSPDGGDVLFSGKLHNS